MLRITIELIPRGDIKRRRTLHTVDIANDASGDIKTGNYIATLSKRGSSRVWRCVRVLGFPRKWLGPYDLLYQVLWAVCSERAPRRIECDVIRSGGTADERRKN